MAITELIANILIIFSAVYAAHAYAWSEYRFRRKRREVRTKIRKTEDEMKQHQGKTMDTLQLLKYVYDFNAIERKSLQAQLEAALTGRKQLKEEIRFRILESRHDDICEALKALFGGEEGVLTYQDTEGRVSEDNQ